jgi:hypothetical protein
VGRRVGADTGEGEEAALDLVVGNLGVIGRAKRFEIGCSLGDR